MTNDDDQVPLFSKHTRMTGTAIRLLTTLQFVLVASAFVSRHAPRNSLLSSCIRMGLYDDDNEEPVPRFVADNDKKQQDDDEYLSSITRLFDVQSDGTEARGLLPRLLSGAQCSFQETDRPVQNLATKLACHPMDAAWALESSNGDVAEAWLTISTARKQLLNQQDDDDYFDADLFQVLQAHKEMVSDDEEGFEQRKKRMAKEKKEAAQRQALKDAFSGGEMDGEWLPTPQNPNPVDDEPWFTG